MGPRTASILAKRALEIIQRDEGGRGIRAFTFPVAGDLLAASLALAEPSVRIVAILTGFPCLLDHSPPTETDGIGGAFAIAQACAALGKSVVLFTDECNEEVFIAAAGGCGISGNQLSLASFPPASEFGASEAQRLLESADAVDAVVAIERPGPAANGSCYTMRGRDMSPVLAPLHQMLDLVKEKDRQVVTVGIGDGGNELGMGKVRDAVLTSSVPLAVKVSCVVPVDHLVVASVSDWGGFALAACLLAATLPENPMGISPPSPGESIAAAAAGMSEDPTATQQTSGASGAESSSEIAAMVAAATAASDGGEGADAAAAGESGHAISSSLAPTADPEGVAAVTAAAVALLEAGLPGDEAAFALLSRAVEAGARDGVSGLGEATVDGMPFSRSLEVLGALRAAFLASAREALAA